MIFVFGSNLAGIHGAGAAKVAHRNYGAEWGTGSGLTGNSYAIPTKDMLIDSLPLGTVQNWVTVFLGFARDHPDMAFQVTQIGCGLAGFTKEQIAPMFADAPKNCFFDTAWRDLMPEGTEFWGTYPG